jgi:hypothetical protein
MKVGPKAKCVVIEKKMKQTFDSNTPPTWFVDFQKQTLEFQTMVVSRLDKIEIRLDRLESDVKSIHHRIDNLVKLNKLKE